MQTTLPFAPTIAERFQKYHEQNPHVYQLFVKYAEEVRAEGYKRFSADAILHQIRWYHFMQIRTADFKVNNDFSAHYARLLIANDPSFERFFETRRIRAN